MRGETLFRCDSAREPVFPTRWIRSFQIMLIAWLSFGCCVPNCFAHALWLIPGRTLYGVLGGFLLTLIVEYSVIHLFIWRRVNAPVRLFFWVLLVNVITFSASQFAMALFVTSVPRFVWLGLIEFAVVVGEFAMFRPIFERLYRMHALDQPVSTKRTFAIAFSANLASFIVGSAVELIMIFVLE